VEELFLRLLEEIGENPNREGLMKTPERAAESIAFLTQGYQQTLEEVLGDAVFEESYDDMVVLKDCEFYSLCEHHVLPFFGKTHVAYIPRGKIIGISKIARVVDLFARRLQVQERMTMQIAEALQEVLNPHGVAVVQEAQHLCMMLRGVEKQDSRIVTSAVLGVFRTDPKTRAEFMDLLRVSGR
jgi:GTP cyclohydrolase I